MSSKVIRSSEAGSVARIDWDTLTAGPDAKPAHTEGPAGQVQDRLAQLQQRFDAEVAAAYQRGHSDGMAKAKAGPVAEINVAIQRMAQSVRELADLRPRLRRDAEGDVVRLSLAIARRVLRREMSVDPSSMQALAQVALQKLGRQEISRVYVHPDQAQAIQAALDSAGVRVELIPEITRESGALVFQTNQGLLDVSVNAQLEEIERGLTDRLNQS